MTDCIFCKILSGEAEATFVHRDEDVAAFMDIQPVNAGHVLVVPTRHAPYLADIDAQLSGRIMQIAHHLAAGIRRSGLRCEGINLLVADGEAAMQDVFHLHLHVIPRFVGDGFGLVLPPGYTNRPPRTELEDAAARIRFGLGASVP